MSDNLSNFSFSFDYVTVAPNKTVPKTSVRSDGPRPFPSSWSSSTPTWGNTVSFRLGTSSPPSTKSWTTGPTYK
ncbi:hypothetical protein SPBR_03385 [Sporothrix brasiliensis 5110]|uniref:Uncharacterized protein n=1 Tax=Sporothrix brasiliensis 5110 TaxID=1398154 RepID=A0A0C2ISN1_9PEZI|nr:uncharacterized protein SPBR_03385 [Sporothrix brasiliensis 5110]KIH92066.1 hypothetical protein SPBR_03385 [Sporothrix brasiliensis 5110]